MTATRPLTCGQADGLRVRSYLQEHRHDLTLAAADDYPAAGAAVLRLAWRHRDTLIG